MVVHNETPLSTRSLYEVIVVEDVTNLVEPLQPWVIISSVGGKGLRLGSVSIDPQIFLEVARPHELTRPMTQEEKNLLMASILDHGVESHIYLDTTGRVIDGYHRVLVCCELLLMNKTVPPIPTRFVKFRDQAAEAEFVMLANLARRHLTTDDKKKFLKELLMTGCDYGDNALAKKLSLATGTVTPVREFLEDSGAIPTLPKRRGINNNYYPVKTGKRSKKEKKPAREVKDPTFPINESEPSCLPTESVNGHELSSERPAAVGSEVKLSLLPPEQSKKAVDQSVNITTETEESPDAADCEDLESDHELNDDDKLLEAWWKWHGIEPLTSAHLLDLTRGDSDQPLTAQELKSDQTKIGVKLSGLMKSRDNRYTIQKMQVGRSTVYYIRPKAWSKHGPVN